MYENRPIWEPGKFIDISVACSFGPSVYNIKGLTDISFQTQFL